MIVEMSATETNQHPTSKRSIGTAPQIASAIRSGFALKSWRRKRGITRPVFAQIADCSERTLATYEKQAKLPAKFSRPIIESVKLILALEELAGDKAALKEWLQKPNAAFEKKTPLDLIRSGEVDILWRMVHQIRQGSFA